MVKIVMHCSDSGFGNAALISKWHSLPVPQGRGWSGIGYHYVILNGWLTSALYNDSFDGHIETGRPLDDDPFVSKSEMGAHVRGFNTNSVGVCLIGKSGKFTQKQLESALKLMKELEDRYHNIEIFQHSDLDKAKPYCAGLNMQKFKSNYKIYKEIKDIQFKSSLKKVSVCPDYF